MLCNTVQNIVTKAGILILGTILTIKVANGKLGRSPMYVY